MTNADIWQIIVDQNPRLGAPDDELVRLKISGIRKLCHVCYKAGLDEKAPAPSVHNEPPADFGDIFNDLMRGRKP